MKKYVYTRHRFSNRSLAEAVEYAKSLGVSLEDVNIIHFKEYDWDCSEHVSGLEYKRLESDSEYSKRLKFEKEQTEERERKERLEYQRLSEKYFNN